MIFRGAVFVEMTKHRVAHLAVQTLDVVRFRENRLPQGTSDIPTLRGLVHVKNDLIHI